MKQYHGHFSRHNGLIPDKLLELMATFLFPYKIESIWIKIEFTSNSRPYDKET
jgi:hypothetical protein